MLFQCGGPAARTALEPAAGTRLGRCCPSITSRRRLAANPHTSKLLQIRDAPNPHRQSCSEPSNSATTRKASAHFADCARDHRETLFPPRLPDHLEEVRRRTTLAPSNTSPAARCRPARLARQRPSSRIRSRPSDLRAPLRFARPAWPRESASLSLQDRIQMSPPRESARPQTQTPFVLPPRPQISR